MAHAFITSRNNARAKQVVKLLDQTNDLIDRIKKTERKGYYDLDSLDRSARFDLINRRDNLIKDLNSIITDSKAKSADINVVDGDNEDLYERSNGVNSDIPLTVTMH